MGSPPVRPCPRGLALCALAAWAAGSLAGAAAPTAWEVCATGVPIARVEVQSIPVFDPTLPGSEHWAYRLVNRLHAPMQTRPSTIRALTTVQEGEPCSVWALEEAERTLRSLVFVQDAWVEPVAVEDEGLVVAVRVQDSWSTRPGLSISHEGGETRVRARLVEDNVLGYGKRFEVSYEEDQDRIERLLSYQDPAVFGSRYRARFELSDNSDGERALVSVERPFWSYDDRFTLLAEIDDEVREEKVYEGGDELDRWRVDGFRSRFDVGGSPRGLVDDRVFRWRAGIELREESWENARPESTIGRPELRPYDADLVLAGGALSWSRIEFRRERRLLSDRRVDDIQLGRDLHLGLRLSLPGISEDDGGRVSLGWRQGFALSDRSYLLSRASYRAELLRGGRYDAISSLELTYLRRDAPARAILVRLAVDRGQNLTGPSRFLLGGDTGLRGYRSRAFSGSRRLLFVAERRFFSDLTLGRFLGLGLVVFFEAGGAFDEDHFGWDEIHPDIGVGLRLSLLPSASGTTLHLNAAMPLDPNGEPEGRNVRFSFTTATGF